MEGAKHEGENERHADNTNLTPIAAQQTVYHVVSPERNAAIANPLAETHYTIVQKTSTNY